MEFWLMQDKEKFQLPVPPAEYNVPNEIIVDTFNVENLGEVSFIGKRKLSSTSINSLFPNQKYNFCQYLNFPYPYECVKLIKKWQQSGKPIRLVITETDVNMLCTIEKFTYGEKFGDRDVYFTLDLREYRKLEGVSFNVS